MDPNLCAICKGKNLCGKPFCEIASKVKQYKAIIESTDKNFTGTSPPACFVGRAGYPKVNLNILTPSYEDKESWVRDAPNFWHKEKMSISNILEKRTGMVAVRSQVDVKTHNPGRFLEIAQEIAQSEKQVSAEYTLKNKPTFSISVDSRMAPIGSPAEAEKVTLTENTKISRPVDKAVSDTDFRATDAANYLYEKNISENTITKILSLGLLGLKQSRKIVPTRWSITATDDILSKKLVEEIKDNKATGDYRLYTNTYLGNHFEILIIPKEWQFEVIETKLPGSVWNPNGEKPILFEDYETYDGRKTYADQVTGAYYSARLAVAERMKKDRIQGAVFIIREVHPEYDTPMGVWVIRETIRGAMENPPAKFETLNDALDAMKKRLVLPFGIYREKSRLLKNIRTQTTLSSFI